MSQAHISTYVRQTQALFLLLYAAHGLAVGPGFALGLERDEGITGPGRVISDALILGVNRLASVLVSPDSLVDRRHPSYLLVPHVVPEYTESHQC